MRIILHTYLEILSAILIRKDIFTVTIPMNPRAVIAEYRDGQI
jgi:hypothetical protein